MLILGSGSSFHNMGVMLRSLSGVANKDDIAKSQVRLVRLTLHYQTMASSVPLCT